jgi:trimeric autotransporter adhesin
MLPASFSYDRRPSVSLVTLWSATLLLATAGCGDSVEVPPSPNPTPDISSLAPAEFEEGSGGGTLVIMGSDFIASSQVLLGGAGRSSTLVSRSELRTELAASDLVQSGSIEVRVANPPPGGGTSRSVALPIRPRVAPVPFLSRLSPDHVLAGDPAAAIAAEGAGFLSSSIVRVGGSAVPTTYESSTRIRAILTAAQTEVPGSLPVTVFTPAPGGGSSNSMALGVFAPEPVISSLEPGQVDAAQDSFVLRVRGTGFFSLSEVLFEGEPRDSRQIDASTLEADLLSQDLGTVGTFAITVRNPSPGGGLSNSRVLNITSPVPRISTLPSSGATAGGSGFTLMVHGTGFTTSSIVRWSGSDRSTQLVGRGRLAASIGAADVATPGSVDVTVFSPGAGGGSSQAATIQIRTVPSDALTSVIRQTIAAKDVVYDDRTASLYVSVAASDPVHGNGVARIDPNTGQVSSSVFVGSDPARLGLSDDGAYLYVGLNGASAVRRLPLSTFEPDIQWPLSGGEVAGDIEVLPGGNTVVAVSRHRPGYSPPLTGVTLYDNGSPRPTSSPGHTGGARIALLESTTTLYGFNNAHTGFEFFTIGVSSDGLRHTSQTRGLISGFYTDIEGAAGRIYGTDGSVVDPELLTKVGSLAGSIAIAVDPTVGRAFLLENASIGVYDLNTFQRLGTIPVAGWKMDHPARIIHRMVRWGKDGLAFLDLDELFIVRSPIIGT